MPIDNVFLFVGFLFLVHVFCTHSLLGVYLINNNNMLYIRLNPFCFRSAVFPKTVVSCRLIEF